MKKKRKEKRLSPAVSSRFRLHFPFMTTQFDSRHVSLGLAFESVSIIRLQLPSSGSKKQKNRIEKTCPIFEPKGPKSSV